MPRESFRIIAVIAAFVALAAFLILGIIQSSQLTTGARVPRGGEQIAYLRPVERVNSLYDAYLFQMDSDVSTQLTQGGQIRNVVWTPDGEYLTLQFEPTSYDRTQIYLLNVGTGELRSLFETDLNVARMQWSPDGEKLVFEGNRSGFGVGASVMSYDRETSELRTLVDDGAAPSISPDGQTIAFSAARAGDEDREIYLMDSDGSSIRKLLENPGTDTIPTWSPDGQRLLIASTTSDIWGGTVAQTVLVVNVDGTGLAHLAESEVYDFAAWSPDSQQILYRDVSRDVCLIRADGEDKQCLDGVDSAVWSPDGTRLAYSIATLPGEAPPICLASIESPLDKQCFSNNANGFVLGWRP